MRRIAKALMVILGVVVAFEVVDTALHLWSWRSRSPRSLRLIKRYIKHVINPVMLRFSGRSGHSAVVHHLGRRSGTRYATPVIAHQSRHDVIVPLPYGTDVDRLRNLLAARQAVVDLEGRSLQVDEQAVVDIKVVDLLPASMVRTVRFNGAREALRLRVSEPTPESACGLAIGRWRILPAGTSAWVGLHRERPSSVGSDPSPASARAPHVPEFDGFGGVESRV